jgi:hypothetical protein
MESQNQEDQVVNFVSYNVHASNALFVILEFLLNRMKFAGAHVLFPVGWAMIYMGWSWIYFDWTGDWVYFFVDTSQNSAPGWYLLMLVMHCAFFGMGYGLWYLKERKLILKQKLAIRDSYDSHTSFSGSSSSSLLPGGGRA